jgi:hypothetical protein
MPGSIKTHSLKMTHQQHFCLSIDSQPLWHHMLTNLDKGSAVQLPNTECARAAKIVADVPATLSTIFNQLHHGLALWRSADGAINYSLLPLFQRRSPEYEVGLPTGTP